MLMEDMVLVDNTEPKWKGSVMNLYSVGSEDNKSMKSNFVSMIVDLLNEDNAVGNIRCYNEDQRFELREVFFDEDSNRLSDKVSHTDGLFTILSDANYFYDGDTIIISLGKIKLMTEVFLVYDVIQNLRSRYNVIIIHDHSIPFKDSSTIMMLESDFIAEFNDERGM